MQAVARQRKAGLLLIIEPHRKGRQRGRCNPTKVWRRMMAAITKAGGTRITMYGMRHTFASNEHARVGVPQPPRYLHVRDVVDQFHRHYLLSYDDDINATASPKGLG